jgi:23S rRNA (adenine2503-C2)-methyltransferase
MRWIYRARRVRFSDMTDLSQSLRQQLEDDLDIRTSALIRRRNSSDGVQKLLLGLPGGDSVETVLIPDGERFTACVSTQVGCPVGCRFCASGIEGLERNLSTGEIVEQALAISELLPADEKLTNLVMMGSGEPLANYGNLVRAIRTLNADWGMGIGARRITVSTVGLPSQIRRLAREGLQLNLAISLHAPDDDLRAELIPWQGRATIFEIVEAAREYFDRTGREITLEYVLLSGVNDSIDQARRLAALLKPLRCDVNLLRYNPVAGLGYQRPSAQLARLFQETLRKSGVKCHTRKSRGTDIEAACGQLKRAAATSVVGSTDG